MLFTTSWDDGYTLDMRIAGILERYGCTGTFYVCPRTQHGRMMLSPESLKELSQKHEVGAHTLRHPKLTKIAIQDAKQEIEGSKKWVEERIGKSCDMFCYPYGDWNEPVKYLVQQAGFKGARTVSDLLFATTDPFAMPTSIQVTPFPKRRTFSRWWHPFDLFGPLRVRMKRLRELGIPLKQTTSWLTLTTALFDYALATNQPHFHVWGHSHELERYNMWHDVEKFLTYVQTKDNVQKVTNSALV